MVSIEAMVMGATSPLLAGCFHINDTSAARSQQQGRSLLYICCIAQWCLDTWRAERIYVLTAITDSDIQCTIYSYMQCDPDICEYPDVVDPVD